MFIKIQETRIKIEEILWYGKKPDDTPSIIIGLQGKSIEFTIDFPSEGELNRALSALDNLCNTKIIPSRTPERSQEDKSRHSEEECVPF